MQILTSIVVLSTVTMVAIAAPSFEDLKTTYIKFLDEAVPPEKRQMFKDGFAQIKGCISPLVSKIDFNILQTVAAGVTKAGVECGKSVQDMDEAQQQAQYMPCVRTQLQDLMNQKSDAEKAMFMEAKDCIMNILESPSSSS